MLLFKNRLLSWRNQVMESPTFVRLTRKMIAVSSPLIEGKQTDSGYITSPIYRALHPGTSGNKINGLGEDKRRRPFRILWTADDETPFGKLQRLFLITSGMKGTVKFTDHLHTHGLAQREKKQYTQPPLSPPKVLTKAELTSAVKKVAKEAGGDIVGITEMKEDWIFDNTELPSWAYDIKGNLDARLIVIGVEMDYEHFGVAPELPAATEAMKQYDRGTESALSAGDFLLQNGYHGWGHAGPRAGRFLLIPAAAQAGLGNLGKHGSLISKEYGSSLRLGAVLTNADLVLDGRIDFGSEDFCINCQICVRECPVDALSSEKQMVRGVEKYYVNFDKCLPYFLDNNGCGICASKCPYSRPEVRPKLLNKHEKKLNKRQNKNIKAAQPIKLD